MRRESVNDVIHNMVPSIEESTYRNAPGSADNAAGQDGNLSYLATLADVVPSNSVLKSSARLFRDDESDALMWVRL